MDGWVGVVVGFVEGGLWSGVVVGVVVGWDVVIWLVERNMKLLMCL